MFSKSNSFNKEPEGLFFRRHSNSETNNLNVNKNRKTSDAEIDLINLEHNVSITRKPDDNKIDDLQIRELEKFLSTVEISNLQNGQAFTKEQEAQYQLFFDKYEHDQKAKNTNKIKLKTQVINFPGTSNEFIITPRVLTPKLYNVETHQDSAEDLIDEVLLEKNLEKQKQHYSNIPNFNKVTHNESNQASPKSVKIKSEAENDIMTKIISNNEINYITSSRLADKNVKLKNDLSKTNAEHHTKHINAKINEQVSKLNIKYLEAIMFDEKLFTKRNLLKSDSEKLHLTKGPTLCEKSVALPHIMKRLVDTKKMLEGNLERKLALDTGTSNFKLVNDNSNVSPNLRETPHSFNKTVIYPNHEGVTAVKKPNEITTSLGVTSKNNKPLQASVPGSTNKSMAAENDVINRDNRFIPIDELKALRREKLRNEDKDDCNHVLMPPQMLMSDCNKNRFVAHATGTLLHDFIYGKY